MSGRTWLVTMLAVAAIGAASMRSVSPQKEAAAANVEPAVQDREATVHLGGRLEPELRDSLVNRFAGEAGVTVVVLSASDIYTCNDLPRQLRRLVRWADSHQSRLAIATDHGTAERLKPLFFRERITAPVVALPVLDSPFQEGARPRTPLVLVASSDGTARAVARLTPATPLELVDWVEALSPR